MQATDEAELRAAMEIANSVQLQLFHDDPRKAPLLLVLMQAKKESIAALAALAQADPDVPGVIRELQAKVSRFKDLVEWTTEILKGGDEAYAELTANDDPEAVRELIRNQIAGEGDDE
jgi:hypothetical protein